jgi:hypothetical protein
MKYFAGIIMLLCCSRFFAQDCSNFYYLQNNKTIELTITNNKGKETGKMVYTISDGKKSGNILTATVNSEFFDSKGKSVNKAVNNVQCENGMMMMDMKMFIPSAQQEQMGTASASASNVYLEYPAGMNVGDQLKDGLFNMDFETGGGLKSSIEISITERKVEAMESIMTPAGTWECFKISTKNKITTKIAGIGIPIRMDVTEWFAPGFGVVKTESKTGKTEITSIK